MVRAVDQPRRESQADAFGPIPASQHNVDVPGLITDRIGVLYAEEERNARSERTERSIRAAEALH